MVVDFDHETLQRLGHSSVSVRHAGTFVFHQIPILFAHTRLTSSFLQSQLLMLDRTDEWQLFEYIANFKGIQFLSGVIAMFRGTLMYMVRMLRVSQIQRPLFYL